MWRNAMAAAIIFDGERVDDRPRHCCSPPPLRNEHQFFQPRTMCRISALCRPIPPCPVMRHGRYRNRCRPRFPFHFCGTTGGSPWVIIAASRPTISSRTGGRVPNSSFLRRYLPDISNNIRLISYVFVSMN